MDRAFGTFGCACELLHCLHARARTHTHRFRMVVVVLHVLEVFIRPSGLVSGCHDDDDDDEHAAVFLSLLRAFGFTMQEEPFD